MSMKLGLLYWFALVLMIGFAGCSSDDDDDLLGNWIELGSFEGIPRSDAVAFTVGEYAYVGTGYDGEDDERLNDFWRYDATKDYWTQVQSMPGIARNGAVAFGISTKGYVTTGYDGVNKLKDTWEYNPEANEWTQKADFPGSERYGAVSFAIDNKGYVGTGYDGNLLKDFWMYDPASDSWEQKVSVGGKKRRDAVAFVVNGKGYVVTGTDNGQYLTDFWEYDPEQDIWNEKRKIEDDNEDESYDDDYEIAGINGVAFSVNGMGYVTTGGPGFPGVRTWEYHPTTDLWEERTEFEGSPRYEAVAFVINNEPFVATGRSSGYYFDDVWMFDPTAEYDEYD
ncbi:galactose oxidase [Marinilabiliaceae bacterium JC017]|nr:galactose oxidase [Marinilabiliaceae bacterium JC017]